MNNNRRIPPVDIDITPYSDPWDRKYGLRWNWCKTESHERQEPVERCRQQHRRQYSKCKLCDCKKLHVYYPLDKRQFGLFEFATPMEPQDTQQYKEYI